MAKLTIVAVIYDEDLHSYRKADKAEIALNEAEFAVYENGSLCDVYATQAEAKQVIKELY